jgi:hypothetical protein
MTEKEILALGFTKHETEYEGETFTEFTIGNDSLGIVILGFTLVELQIDSRFITVPNVNDIAYNSVHTTLHTNA